MTASVQRHGRYRLFETPRQNRILVLNDDLWYAWVEGQQGELLVRSDSDHESRGAIREGESYLVDFADDPGFTDVPHLFLERDGGFQEVILPNGLPTDDDNQKRVVGSDKSIPREDLEQALGTDGRDASSRYGEDGRESRPHGGELALAIPGFDELSIRGARPLLDQLSDDELRALRSYEEDHKRRKTLLHEIDRRLR